MMARETHADALRYEADANTAFEMVAPLLLAGDGAGARGKLTDAAWYGRKAASIHAELGDAVRARILLAAARLYDLLAEFY